MLKVATGQTHFLFSLLKADHFFIGQIQHGQKLPAHFAGRFASQENVRHFSGGIPGGIEIGHQIAAVSFQIESGGARFVPLQERSQFGFPFVEIHRHDESALSATGSVVVAIVPSGGVGVDAQTTPWILDEFRHEILLRVKLQSVFIAHQLVQLDVVVRIGRLESIRNHQIIYCGAILRKIRSRMIFSKRSTIELWEQFFPKIYNPRSDIRSGNKKSYLAHTTTGESLLKFRKVRQKFVIPVLRFSNY